MLVHVLHHANCFDGTASACLFAAFFRDRVDRRAQFRFVPKGYGAPSLYEPSDFGGDVNASVDFRYTADPRLHWYFDHHRSAFVDDAEREHFLADTTEQKFFDPIAPSCARLIAEVASARFGFEASRYTELLAWADTIDTAGFDSPQAALSLDEPALQLAAFIQRAGDEASIARLIHELIDTPIEEIVRAPYVRSVVEERAELHRANAELLTARCEQINGVLTYDLLDEAPRVLNHFLPYGLFPTTRYVVGAYVGSDGSLKLTAGYNPWLDRTAREHNIADLCEQFGGGGHAHVGGCTLGGDQRDQLRAILGAIAENLRADPSIAAQ